MGRIACALFVSPVSLMVLVAGCLVACAGAGPTSGPIVDLTHAFGADTLYWPTDGEGFVHERGSAGYTEAGYYYSAHRFRSAEHGGTHVDAPVHFAEHGVSVDAIPLTRLVGQGVRVDVRAACASDPDYRVTVADLERFEDAHGRIPTGAIVLLHTGFASRWPDRERYLGTADRGPDATHRLHFPGLHPDAARWLVAERAIAAVGLDTASIDHGPSQDFATHQVLAAAGVPVFENLASLDGLPPREFRVVALPMKIAGGSGAPLRILAFPQR
ncbi:MAG: cyclase family protein [Proteobacteria bacterium]|nr:cyclase family protein [Pseudomonadota bacterium]